MVRLGRWIPTLEVSPPGAQEDVIQGDGEVGQRGQVCFGSSDEIHSVLAGTFWERASRRRRWTWPRTSRNRRLLWPHRPLRPRRPPPPPLNPRRPSPTPLR